MSKEAMENATPAAQSSDGEGSGEANQATSAGAAVQTDSNEESGNDGDGNSAPNASELSLADGDDEQQGQDGGEKGSEEIKIELPEGTNVSAELLEGFKAFAMEHKLGGELANKVAGWYAGEVAKMDAAMSEAIERQRTEWSKAVASDSELGGANTEQTKQNLAAFKQRYSTPEFREEVRRMGIDTHPEFIRVMARVGADLGEDRLSGAAPARGGTSKEAELYKLFPNSVNPDGSWKR